MYLEDGIENLSAIARILKVDPGVVSRVITEEVHDEFAHRRAKAMELLQEGKLSREEICREAKIGPHFIATLEEELLWERESERRLEEYRAQFAISEDEDSEFTLLSGGAEPAPESLNESDAAEEHTQPSGRTLGSAEQAKMEDMRNSFEQLQIFADQSSNAEKHTDAGEQPDTGEQANTGGSKDTGNETTAGTLPAKDVKPFQVFSLLWKIGKDISADLHAKGLSDVSVRNYVNLVNALNTIRSKEFQYGLVFAGIEDFLAYFKRNNEQITPASRQELAEFLDSYHRNLLERIQSAQVSRDKNAQTEKS